MDCICSSHHLYSESNESNTFHKKSPCTTNCSSKRTPLNSYPSFSSPYVDLYKSSIEISSITFPSEIQKIDFLEILDNPLFFQKEFISKNVPCLITNALDDWDALDLWSDMNYLSEKINKKITIDINPDGFADSIKNEYFTQPLQIQGTISEYNNIRENDKTMVPYIQMQNNNFNKEFIDVFPENEINQNLSSFFGKNFFSHSPIPDATNFWMGDERSVSSLHKDHYENIYCVINGEKHFTLIPPIFYPLFFEGKFRQGKWVLENEEWILDNHDEEFTHWLTVNPDSKRDWNNFGLDKFEDLLKVYHVEVQKGEVLYLPSLWLHQVSQINKKNEAVIAVNHWFDMEFGNNFALLELVRGLFK